jgi:general secretion pathway protein G
MINGQCAATGLGRPTGPLGPPGAAEMSENCFELSGCPNVARVRLTGHSAWTTLRAHSGFTFIELLVVTTILLIMASAVLPLAKVTVQRTREAELRRALREMRTAIDKYKDAVDNGLIGSIDIKAGSEGYPPDLDTLVEGVSVANDATGRKLKFLRRVPIDPMTGSSEWGMRAYADKPDATSWGGSNVYDVFSKSQGTALDGTKYKDW